MSADVLSSESSTAPVLIVDGSNAFVRAYCAYPSVSSHGYQLGGFVGFMKTLTKLVNDYAPSGVIIVWEGGGSSRRRSIYADYKMNRRPEKLNRFYADDIPDSDENRVHQTIALVKLLRCLPVWQLYAEDVEGDDVIAYLTCGPLIKRPVMIASSDKDMHQLLCDRVTQFSFHKKRVLTASDVYDEYGILAENFGIAKAVCGDSSDNIPGVSRIGFKTLVKSVSLVRERGVIVDDVINFASSHRHESHSCERIANAEKLIRRNWELVKLDITSLSPAKASQICALLQTPRSPVDVVSMYAVLMQEGTSSLNVDDIVTAFGRYKGCMIT